MAVVPAKVAGPMRRVVNPVQSPHVVGRGVGPSALRVLAAEVHAKPCDQLHGVNVVQVQVWLPERRRRPLGKAAQSATVLRLLLVECLDDTLATRIAPSPQRRKARLLQ